MLIGTPLSLPFCAIRPDRGRYLPCPAVNLLFSEIDKEVSNMKRTYYFSKARELIYEEVLPDSDMFEKFYEIQNSRKESLVVIPDGCVDVQCVWKRDQMSMWICGSVMNGAVSGVSGYDKCYGARFKAGKLPEILKKYMDIIIENRIPARQLEEISGMLRYLDRSITFDAWIDVIREYFEIDHPTEENALARGLIREIEKRRGHVVIQSLVDSFGYSHRYANYVFKSNVGCSIKKYASIVRLQESLNCMMNQDDDAIYNDLGYYDQAHFIRDFKNFSHATPYSFKKMLGNLRLV